MTAGGEQDTGMYRRTVVVGEDAANGRTRYFYGWGRVTFHADMEGKVATTVIEWREPPKGTDHYPSDGEFPDPRPLPAAPRALESVEPRS